MRRMVYFLSFGIVAAIISASQVRSEPVICADHAEIIAQLAKHFGETRQLIGMRDDQTTVEIFASLDTGSWTIAETSIGGSTCLAAAGQAYEYRSGKMAQYYIGLEHRS